MPRIIIGVLSHKEGKRRRRAVLSTWGQDALDHPDIDLVFLIGTGMKFSQPQREGHMLYLPCPDDYMSLPQKTRWFCIWALGWTNFRFLFKCDDDTYVNIDRLYECSKTLPDHHFLYGCRGGRGTRANLQGGAGYYLTRKGTAALAAFLDRPEGAEDRGARAAVELFGTRFRYCPQLWYRPSIWPAPDNDYITTHQISPRKMKEIHKAFQQEKEQ